MTFQAPLWLLAAIPLAAALWLWTPPTRLLASLRITTHTLLLLALAGASAPLPRRTGMLVVVADRSSSMPPGSDAVETEIIRLAQRTMPEATHIGVVSFGDKAVVESPPGNGFAGFAHRVGGDASNLGAGVERALSLIPEDLPARILVLSDGRWSGTDPSGAASRSAARGIAIDYRHIERPRAGDVAFSRVDAPSRVRQDEPFALALWVHSPVTLEASIDLTRNGRPAASGRVSLRPGVNRVAYRDVATGPGTLVYEAVLRSQDADPAPENNRAKWLVRVDGPPLVVHVSTGAESTLARLLQGGGINLAHRLPNEMSWNLDELSGTSAVILENLPAAVIGAHGMETMATWVQESGSGLMVTGGKSSYGPGGYFRSALDPLLPVSMELRQEHRKLAVAIVVALDRSGSMAVSLPGGRTKMDLADLAAAQVLDLLSPMDEFGAVAVDSSAHLVAPLAPATDKEVVRARLLQIASEGGGIFIYEALTAAAGLLVEAESQTRHIILFADATDSEEPGAYRELLEKCRSANVTVSVIGLGKPNDPDADLLRDIASRGQGTCSFTEDAHELPRLFAQDTFSVARSTFIDETTPIAFTPGMSVLGGTRFDERPAIGGYNLTYVKPKVTLAASSVDEYSAPLVAAWHAGAGRVLCYTGEADGKYSGAIASWTKVGELFTTLCRWTAGEPQVLPSGMQATQEIRDETYLIELHLDPEEPAPFVTTPVIRALRGVPGGRPEAVELEMEWATPQTLTARIPFRGSETVLPSVEIPGTGRVTLPPACLPYSAEYRPILDDDDRGRPTLDRLARLTGGKERLDLSGLANDMPIMKRLVELKSGLLLSAIAIFLCEVLERRTSVFSTGWRYMTHRRTAAPQPAETEEVPASPPPAHTAPKPIAASPLARGTEEPASILDAIGKARKRARKRLDKR